MVYKNGYQLIDKFLGEEFQSVPASYSKISHYNELYTTLARIILKIDNSKDTKDKVTRMENSDCVEFFMKNQTEISDDKMHVNFYFDDEHNLEKLGMLYVNEFYDCGNRVDTVKSLYIKEQEDDTISVELEEYYSNLSHTVKIHETYDKLGNLIRGKCTDYLDDSDFEVSTEIHKSKDNRSYLYKGTVGAFTGYAKVGLDKVYELGSNSVNDLIHYDVNNNIFEILTENEYLEMLPSKVKNSDNKELVK